MTSRTGGSRKKGRRQFSSLISQGPPIPYMINEVGPRIAASSFRVWERFEPNSPPSSSPPHRENSWMMMKCQGAHKWRHGNRHFIVYSGGKKGNFFLSQRDCRHLSLSPPPNGGGDPGLRKRLLQSGRQCDNEGTRKGYKVPRMWLKEVRAYVQPLENSEVHVVKGGERKIF